MTDNYGDGFRRLEDRLDKLTDAVTQLVRVEERQITHTTRLDEHDRQIGDLQTDVSRTERDLSKWVNRGIGVWGFAVLAWTMYLALLPNGP